TAAGPRIAPEPPRIEPAPRPSTPAPPAVAPPPSVAPPLPTLPPVTAPAIVARQSTDVLVSLPDGEEGERPPLTTPPHQARDDIARLLGVQAPARVSVRFHPTTDDYTRATLQPWFTSGAFVNAELHMPPLAVLRERGVLERAVRHELVHMMVDSTLEKRPE